MDQTTYEQTTEKAIASSGLGSHREYVRTLPGILKLTEIAVSVLVLICGSIDYWSPSGAGWVYFVGVSAIITTLIVFLLHFCGVASKFSPKLRFVEFCYYFVFVVLYIIAGISCATYAPYFPSVGAAAFFAFVAVAVYGVDTFFTYRLWKGSIPPTTTTTTYETKTQY